MKRILGMVFTVALCFGAGFAQTGPGTVFFYGTHRAADQMLEPYPVGGITGWYLVRAPQPASYYSFHNLLDVHSVAITKNGITLTAQQGPGEPAPDYGYFVISDPVQAGGFAVVVILQVPAVPGDRLRVSFDYVQE